MTRCGRARTPVCKGANNRSHGPPCTDALVPCSSVPAAYPEFLNIGYGVLDSPARVLAAAVLAGTKPLPDRTATDAYFTARDAAVGAQHAAYTAIP